MTVITPFCPFSFPPPHKSSRALKFKSSARTTHQTHPRAAPVCWFHARRPRSSSYTPWNLYGCRCSHPFLFPVLLHKSIIFRFCPFSGASYRPGLNNKHEHTHSLGKLSNNVAAVPQHVFSAAHLVKAHFVLFSGFEHSVSSLAFSGNPFLRSKHFG